MLSRVERERKLAETEVQRLVQELLHARAEVNVEERNDSDGEPSLFVQAVLPTLPKGFSARDMVSERFRFWLANKRGDKRYPYFDFVTREMLEEENSAD